MSTLSKKILIIGSGNLARAIVRLYHESGAQQAHYALKIMSKGHAKDKINFDGTSYDVSPISTEEIQASDIVILAVPAAAVITFSNEYKQALSGKVVIDPSNGVLNNAVNLQSILPDSQVVKAFNTLPVFYVLNEKNSLNAVIQQIGKTTMVYSDSSAALKEVSQFSDALCLETISCRRLKTSVSSEKKNLSTFANWHKPFIGSCLLLFFWILYAFFRYNLGKDVPIANFWSFILNKSICSAGFTLFAYVFLISALGKNAVLNKGSELYKENYPKLIGSLNNRKYIGLIALVLIFTHVLISLCLFGPETNLKFYTVVNGVASKFNLKGSLTVFFGVISVVLFCTFSLSASIPTLARRMGMNDWKFSLRYVTFWAFVFATAHVVVQVVLSAGWYNVPAHSPAGFPSIALAVSIFPVLVILFTFYVAIKGGILRLARK